MSEGSVHKKGAHYAWAIFIGCCCVCAGGMALTASIVGVYMSPMSAQLGCTTGDFALWVTVTGIVSVFTMPLWGKLLQTKNINVVSSVAAILLVIGVLGMGFCTEVWQTYILGALMGLGWAPILVLLVPNLIGNWFAPSKRGRFLGIASAFTGVGTFVWAPLFTVVIQNFGVQFAYIVNAVLMAVLILPWTLFVFKFSPSQKGLEPYGLDAESTQSENAKSTVEASGMSAKQAFRTPTFWMLLIAMGLLAFGMGYNSNQPGIAVEFLSGSMDPSSAALVGASMISVAAVGNIISKIVFGWVVDRFGLKPAFAIFIILFIVAFALWMLFPNNQGALLVGAFLLGTHNSLVAVGFPLVTRTVFGNKDYSKIYSRLTMANALLGSCAVAVIAYLYQAFGSYTNVVLIGIGLVVVMGVLVFAGLASAKKLNAPETAQK